MNWYLILRLVLLHVLLLNLVLVWGKKSLGEYIYNNNNNERVDSISPNDEEKLIKLYGKDNYMDHKDQFLQVANMPRAHQEPIKHIPPPIVVDPDYLHQEMDKARSESLNFQSENQHERSELTKITQPLVKKMIKNLLVRLEMLEMNPLVEPTTVLTDRCTLQGLWVSTVKGVAIHLQPHNQNSLKLTVLDMPQPPAHIHQSEFEHPFVTSDWIGTAHLSSEVPTTISIILQEKWLERDHDAEKQTPKTAVFVGQCLVCNGLPAIQGKWTVFPESPICFRDTSKNPEIDLMYLL